MRWSTAARAKLKSMLLLIVTTWCSRYEMTEKGSMAATVQTEWVFASCDTEHSASAARVECSRIAPKARPSPAVCRCKPMHTFVPYHDTEIARSEKITHHRRRGSSVAVRRS